MRSAIALAALFAVISTPARAVKYESRLTAGERVPFEANFNLELVSYQLE